MQWETKIMSLKITWNSFLKNNEVLWFLHKHYKERLLLTSRILRHMKCTIPECWLSEGGGSMYWTNSAASAGQSIQHRPWMLQRGGSLQKWWTSDCGTFHSSAPSVLALQPSSSEALCYDSPASSMYLTSLSLSTLRIFPRLSQQNKLIHKWPARTSPQAFKRWFVAHGRAFCYITCITRTLGNMCVPSQGH